MASNAIPIFVSLKIQRSNGSSVINIAESNIVSCIIKEHVLSILPRIELVLTDIGNLFESTPIIDKDIILIYFSNGADKGIKTEFQISNFKVNADPDLNKFSKIKIAGHLNCKDGLVTFKNRCIKNTSVGIFQKIASEMGLKFVNKCVNPPVDSMRWIQYGNNYNFLKHVLNRSYMANDCCFLFGDVSGALNFASLTTQLNSVVKFQTEYDRKSTENFVRGLSDILYFDSYDVSNTADIYNDISNYGIAYSEIFSNAKTIEDVVRYNEKNTVYNNKEIENNSKTVKRFDFGMFNDLNLHGNYNKAIIQNKFNRYNLFNVNIKMNINSSTEVKLFDKIYLNLPSQIIKSSLNDTYSGQYLVTGITYKLVTQTPILKEILISRSGINDSLIKIINIL